MPRLYDTQRWKRRRAAFLQANPLCRFCEAVSRVTMATIVDHIVPHKGDPEKFWDETNWAPMCKPCHDGAKAELESTGRIRGCDATGRPLDPAHPWNNEG